MKLIVKKLSETAELPVYGSELSAGLDLRASEDKSIAPNERTCVKTGIAVEWIKNNENDEEPSQFYLRIAPRSGLSVKNGINILAGVVDYPYRGEIGVVLINHGDKEFIIKQGDRIAQAILTRCEIFTEIELSDELSETQRGAGGFGSTGTK